MYEQHFGLTQRPFSRKATGKEVFVGPQTAKTMAGFRKALVARDAVVTVSGAVGTGKTTLVERALDAIGSRYKTVRVGRMKMDPSDVLESLLIVLGVKDRPNGTIQRFTALRKKLRQLQDAETRVFILIEDALRAGADTLAELEALTVADAGESDGASIVVMGDERLFEFMKDPQLAQLQQRVRQRHRIQPLCVAELRGYLKHCLRIAGGDFEQIFDDRSAELIHGLSEGIPRLANTIVDAVLVAAAAQGVKRVSTTMIAAVAADEFGLAVENFDVAARVVDDSPVAEPAIAVEPGMRPGGAGSGAMAETDDAAGIPAPLQDAAGQVAPSIPEESRDSSQPLIANSDDPAESSEDSEDIPHLIQDTLPDLAILSPSYAAARQNDTADTRQSGASPAKAAAADDIPELKPEPVANKAKTPEPRVSASETPMPIGKYSDGGDPELQLVSEAMPATDRDRGTGPVAKGETPSKATNKSKAEPSPLPAADPPELRAEPEPEEAPDRPELQSDSKPVPVAEDLPELDAEPKPVPPVAEDLPELTVESDPRDDHAGAHKNTTEPEVEAPSEFVPQAASDAQPEASPRQDADDIPEWERDPTLAQLKPDLDALEQALAFTHEDPMVAVNNVAKQPEELADELADDDELPEIILDKAIETGIDDLAFEQPSDILPPTPPVRSDPELDRIAADIANAKSLEDIDDIMAETLFGTGISMIAAQVTANPPEDNSANDELELVQEPAVNVASPPEEKAAPPVPQGDASLDSEDGEEISIETRTPVTNRGLDLSASQRLKTVRALNADLHPSLRERGNEPLAADSPQPIEDQINTSITQTLKALKVPKSVLDEDSEEQTKKGFLSRFRRS